MSDEHFPWTFPVTFENEAVVVYINNSTVVHRDVVITEALNRISMANFTIPYQNLIGNENIEILVDSDTIFDGYIIDFDENDDGLLSIRANSRLWELTKLLVPYTEISYTNKSSDWIVEQLLQNVSWINYSSSHVRLTKTLPYIHFVLDSLLGAIQVLCDFENQFCWWDSDTGAFETAAIGDINASTEIINEYTSEIQWRTDYSQIYNLIYVKGGQENGSGDYITTFSWDGESESVYGRKEFKPHVDEEITNISTSQELSDALLIKYKDPIINGQVFGVPYDSEIRIGRTVNVSNTNYNGSYLIQSVTYNLENMLMNITLTNTPIEIENKIRDIDTSIEILKRHVIEAYNSARPINYKLEKMRINSSLNISELQIEHFRFDIDTFGTNFGGIELTNDTIHKV